MILTLISVANAYIIRYPYHLNKPGDLWECGGSWGDGGGREDYNFHYKQGARITNIT